MRTGRFSYNLSPDAFPYSIGLGGGPLVCTLACTSDADCEAARCPDFLAFKHDCSDKPIKCITTLGGSYCMPPCQDGDGSWYSWKCVDGVPVNCERLDESHCDICGCPSGMYCNGNACVPQIEIGEPCEDNMQCVLPHRCGPTQADPSVKRCLVGAGEPCTPDNCEDCVDNGQWCRVQCGTDASHETCTFSDAHCVGTGSGSSWCAPECSSDQVGQSCPAPFSNLKCTKVQDANVYVCF